MPFLFFIIALLYAMVGFGGGSSYIALLVLFEVPYEAIPPVVLACNMIVVSGGSWLFVRRGHFQWELFWPLAAGSLPMAFIGGRIPLSREVFLLLLGVVLLIAGIRLLWVHKKGAYAEIRPMQKGWGLLAGSILGLLAGLVGIGGGIFLAPLMLNCRWALPRQVAAVCSVFILVNSLAGLAGQLWKQAADVSVLIYWPLFVAVLIGGQIGSRLGSGKIPQAWIRTLTGVLVVFVGSRVLIRWFMT